MRPGAFVAAALLPFRPLGALLGAGRVPAPHAAVAGLIAAAALAGLVQTAWVAPVRNNPASRIGTIECLVEHDDWSLNEATHRYVTTDKVRVAGRFYSSKPPLYAAVGSLAYLVAHDLSSHTLAERPQPFVFWLRLVMQVLPFGLALVVGGRLLRSEVRDDWVWLWGVVALAAGTFVFGYAADINNHSLAACLVLAAMGGGISLLRGRRDPWLWAGTGLCAALAVTLDFGAGVFAVSLGAVLLWRARGRGLVWFVLGAELPILVHAHLTVRVTGSLRPFYGMPDLYRYPGSYWQRTANFDALDEPTWVYAFHALVGHHGLFAMTPLFLLAIPGFFGLLRRAEDRPIALWLGLTAALTVAVYVLFGPRNYGGTAQGMRWFIVVAPALWLLALRFGDARAKDGWVRWLLPILVVAGVITAVQALPNPWTVSPWNWLLRDWGLGSVPPWRQLLPG